MESDAETVVYVMEIKTFMRNELVERVKIKRVWQHHVQNVHQRKKLVTGSTKTSERSGDGHLLENSMPYIHAPDAGHSSSASIMLRNVDVMQCFFDLFNVLLLFLITKS